MRREYHNVEWNIHEKRRGSNFEGMGYDSQLAVERKTKWVGRLPISPQTAPGGRTLFVRVKQVLKERAST